MENVEGYKELADGAAEEMSGIQVQDDTHFTIKLVKPYAPFTSVLSTGYCAIYPEAAARKQEIPGVCRYYTEPVLSRWTAIRAA